MVKSQSQLTLEEFLALPDNDCQFGVAFAKLLGSIGLWEWTIL